MQVKNEETNALSKNKIHEMYKFNVQSQGTIPLQGTNIRYKRREKTKVTNARCKCKALV